jgi:hypothetical protein
MPKRRREVKAEALRHAAAEVVCVAAKVSQSCARGAVRLARGFGGLENMARRCSPPGSCDGKHSLRVLLKRGGGNAGRSEQGGLVVDDQPDGNGFEQFAYPPF